MADLRRTPQDEEELRLRDAYDEACEGEDRARRRAVEALAALDAYQREHPEPLA